MEILNIEEKQIEIAQLFWGKVNLKDVFVPFQFLKAERLQSLIHELKYKGNKKLAVELGEKLGSALCEEIITDSIVTYVPMHPKKQKKRGYNQAELLAKGFANVNSLRVDDLLFRNEETESQTDKGVFDRYENMAQRFEVKDSLYPNHVYLVDDVITTGATLVACAKALISVGIEVKVVCLAYRGLED